MTSHSGWVTWGMGLLALAVAALFVWANVRVSPSTRARTLWPVVAVAWLGGYTALALSGAAARWDARPPPLMLGMAVLFVAAVLLVVSKQGARLARGLPLAVLVLSQSFRLPLELVMHRAATEGVMPEQMSFSGYNFDIVSGTTALLLGLTLLGRPVPRWVVIAWNALGSALLLAIIGIAIASTPVMAAFGQDRLNTWVGEFPFIWLPSVLVFSALVGHGVLWRRLLGRPQSSDGAP